MMEFVICFCMVRKKSRRKRLHLFDPRCWLMILFVLLLCAWQLSDAQRTLCGDTECWHGNCTGDGRCLCYPGWQGPGCQRCGGRVRVTEPNGVITNGIGNYSKDMKCTWLIESGIHNATIRFEFTHFETECGWDHLYVYDGDSMFAPMVAAYSGLLLSKGSSTKLPEIVTHSGSAFVHFYSDAVYNMSGFNLTYSVNGCSHNCSSHGDCVDGVCQCLQGWTGSDCGTQVCPQDCNNGSCDKEEKRCICDPFFKGEDCSIAEGAPLYEAQSATGWVRGRAMHQALVLGDAMWVLGGESLTELDQQIAKYDFLSRKWHTVKPTTTSAPANRYGHSVVTYRGKLYLFGGTLRDGRTSNDLWRWDPEELRWAQLSPHQPECQNELCPPLTASGHTAAIVDNTMVVIFGHNPDYGYLNVVQEYTFGTNKWEIVQVKGAIVKGGYGHSSVYDPGRRQILVFGGYHSQTTTGVVVDYLYSYQPHDRTWTLLAPSASHRYLHSAVLLHRMMLVFGGNTHNDTAFSTGDKCFSADLLAYDIECDSWHTLSVPSSSYLQLERFGHSAVVYNESMYIFGGFNGQMLTSIVKYTPGSCRSFSTPEKCITSATGIKCAWNPDKKACQAFHLFNATKGIHTCPRKSAANLTVLCEKQTSCPSCLQNNYGCVWCGTICAHKRCPKGSKGLADARENQTDVEQCQQSESSNCDKLHNCHACHTEFHCGWQNDHRCYTFVRDSGNKTEKAVLSDNYRVKCDNSCSSRTTCKACLLGSCMWCISQQRCLETNAYAATFPLAQCTEWTTTKCSALSCEDFQTCSACQEHERCGWCDDGSNTGKGQCLEGSASGPLSPMGSVYRLNSSLCPAPNWYFTDCPKCQCNGHSTCNGSSECLQSCQHRTEGPHCEHCIAGYHGNPANGGNCTPCFCNNHGTFCHRETGKCNCTTKGIIGPNCDRCDEQNHYVGSPQEEGGTCFYNLSIDFQYTFNLSSEDYYRNINFMNVPIKVGNDVEFTISCSGKAYVNISIGSGGQPPSRADGDAEPALLDSRKCDNIKLPFYDEKHNFGSQNTTFFVYVFNFTTPFVLQISFSQHRALDLLQFFITFSSCFLSLLIIAAILWKIKQKYDLYRRRQQLFVEMEQMASRPFAGVTLELDGEPDGSSKQFQDGMKQGHPTPVALEPCASGKAAVLTLIVRMPTGGQEHTATGQSGLAIASALVSLGTLCKSDTIKEDGKSDCWKPSSHPGTCI
ncbi:attractin-like protein 1 isoform X1 [Dermacentor andersoni]|uniref:attractin-like protein 1 n=2 Tax=Dermacentor TaxID=34619 RepID=UPI00215503DB|nr:attractin-like protein 1 [Dermacentor andersoni]